MPEVLREVVHPAAGADGPASVVLVTQRIGQSLHRVDASHQIPVAVEPSVDLDQG